ncbi:MAG TPA: hypothetical protein VK970_00890 [Candidatus Methylacidiphilales bacterium]|nr:hypothetical protein [Candidatus Methylacidiphilales bacterium]
MLGSVTANIAAMPSTIHPAVDIRAITRGRHHYFGYYDKSPWDPTGRYVLGMEAPFMDRPPRADDVAIVGMTDLQRGGEWIPLAETHAWNWQQGSMLQWLGQSSRVIFNDRHDGPAPRDSHLISRVLDVHSGETRTLDRPIYAVNRTGTAAVSLNFARLQHQRPGYGYPGVEDAWRTVLEPADDGLYALDIATGKSRLIMSTAEVAQHQRTPEFDGRLHRFNHVQFGADPQRFAFLHRYKGLEERSSAVGQTRLFTLNLDGTGLYCLSDCQLVSHYDWRGGDAILAWARRHDQGDHYYLFTDRTPHVECIGREVLPCDGHCSFSPDLQWVLTDTYPDAEDFRTLILYHVATGERIDIGRFHAPPMEWQIRCDLHPRWNRDGTQICIDSLHEGVRQMYVLDVSAIIGAGEAALTAGAANELEMAGATPNGAFHAATGRNVTLPAS